MRLHAPIPSGAGDFGDHIIARRIVGGRIRNEDDHKQVSSVRQRDDADIIRRARKAMRRA